MPRSRLSGLLACTLILPTLTLSSAGGASAQMEEMLEVEAAPDMTVLDGVYTEEQADRGLELFEDRGCATCHDADMGGGDFGPNLTGVVFIIHWRDQTAEDLLAFMQANMPPPGGGLSADIYIDIIAAIFRAQGFPASESTELTEDSLSHIEIIDTRE